MKTCIKCTTPLTEENWAPSRRVQRIYICRRCLAAASIARVRSAGGARFTHSDLRTATLQSVKQFAKRRGLEFNLTLETCPAIPDVCPVLSIPLVFTRGQGRKGKQPNAPVLSRLDTTKGFTSDNVRWVSRRALDFSLSAPEKRSRLIENYRTRLGIPLDGTP